jgi:hypothetical protein
MYLALDQIYDPLRAALPSNPTRRERFVRGQLPARYGIVTLSDAIFQWTLAGLATEHVSKDHNSPPEGGDFRFELFPLHSPLLRES